MPEFRISFGELKYIEDEIFIEAKDYKEAWDKSENLRKERNLEWVHVTRHRDTVKGGYK